MNKYAQWIADKKLLTIESALGQCEKYSKKMVKDFPELSLRCGVVYSHDNPDNYCAQHPVEYLHWWCILPDGQIVDPTKAQFNLIGDLVYRELDPKESIKKCMGCGTYYNGRNCYCGKCKWSNKE